MIKFDEELGHCEVVDEQNLNYRTLSGWTLKAVVQEQLHLPVPKYTEGYNDPQGRWIGPTTKTEYHDSTVTRYLIAKSRDETIKDLAEKITQLERTVANRDDTIREMKSQVEKTKKLEQDLSTAERNYTLLEQARNKYQADVKMRDEEITQLKADFKKLSDHDGSVKLLMTLEDWVKSLTDSMNTADEFTMDAWNKTLKVVGKPPASPRKSWQERLLEEP